MATSTRGRGGVRTRTGSNRFGFTRGGWGKTNTKGRTSGGSSRSVPASYKTFHTTFANKINSFRTLFNQTQGPAKCGRPSPTVLNTFAKWVNKGAIVQTVTASQVAKWAKSTNKNFNMRNPSPTACKNVLCAKFGKNAIKAVARTKTGSFMVAVAPTVGGKPFCLPKK